MLIEVAPKAPVAEALRRLAGRSRAATAAGRSKKTVSIFSFLKGKKQA